MSLQPGFNQMEKVYFFDGHLYIQLNKHNENMYSIEKDILIYNTNTKQTFYNIQDFCSENEIRTDLKNIFECFAKLKYKVYLKVQ